MFLPTLGVLLMLLVGFFDPLAMWNFIKSDTFWAVFIRVILFIAEITLIVLMYFHYLNLEIKEDVLNGNYSTNRKEKRYDGTDLKTIFHNRDGNFFYI